MTVETLALYFHLDEGLISFIFRLVSALSVELGIAFGIAYFVAATVESETRARAVKEDHEWRTTAEREHKDRLEQLKKYIVDCQSTAHSEHKDRLEQLKKLNRDSVELIQKNVFQYLLGKMIPDPVLSEVQLAVFDAKFVRRNLDLHYEFHQLASGVGSPDLGDKLLLMRATVTYRLVNIASERETLDINHYFEDLTIAGEYDGCFTSFEITGCEQELKLTEKELTCRPAAPAGSRYQVTCDGVRRAVKVPDVAVARERPAWVRYTYQTVRRHCDTHTYFVTQPVEDGISIKVTLDDSISQLIRFWPDTAHRLDLKEHLTGPALYEWHLKASLLLGQGVVLYWCPRSEARESPAEVPIRAVVAV